MKNLICFSLLFVLLGGFFHSVKAVDLATNCSIYTFENLKADYESLIKEIDLLYISYHKKLIIFNSCFPAIYDIPNNQISDSFCSVYSFNQLNLELKMIKSQLDTLNLKKAVLLRMLTSCFRSQWNNYQSLKQFIENIKQNKGRPENGLFQKSLD